MLVTIVMISGLFINRKRYSLSKYVLITLVAIGISLFMYNPKVSELLGCRSGNIYIYLYLILIAFQGGQGREAGALYRLCDALRLAAARRSNWSHTGAVALAIHFADVIV